MERHVKERLIGAAVLVAAAVILIPEMLSGGGDGSTERPEAVATAGESPLKTYTIDLSKSPTQSASAETQTLTTSAPPPEAGVMAESELPPAPAAPAPAPKAIPESAAERPVRQNVPDPPVAAEPAPAVVGPATTGAVPAAPSGTASVAAEKASAAGWAVQLGSFSSRATADGMAGKLRDEGYDAFVMPVKSGTGTLYRVRIGPLADRESATNVLGRVKAKVPAAAVVKHP